MSIDSYDWAPPHRRQPAERAVHRPLQQPAGAAVQVRGDLRARVPAPARVLGEPRRAQLDRRGPGGLRDHGHGLRLPGALDLRDGLREPHPDASSAGEPCRRRRTRSRSRTAAPRTRSRSGTTRAASRRSPTTARRGRSWSSSPAATARRFMTDLHNEDANGLKGLQAVLDKYLTGDKAHDVIHDWAAMVALDKAIDDGARLLGFGPASRPRYQTPTLNSSIYWAEPGVVLDAGRAAERVGLRPAPRRERQAAVVVEGDPLDRVLEPCEARRRRRCSGSPSRSPATLSSPRARRTTPTARSSARSPCPRAAIARSRSTPATGWRRAGTSRSSRSRPTTA